MTSTLETVSMIASLAYRNLFRNKRRTVLTLLAIIVGVWSALGLSSLARGLSRQAIDDSINTLLGHGQIHSAKYLDDPVVEESFTPSKEILTALKSNSKISQFTSRVKVPAVALSERHSVGVSLVGINPKEEVGLSFLPEAISQGTYFESDADKGVIVGEAMLEELETEIGRRIVLMSNSYSGETAERGFRIVATFDSSLEATEKSLVFLSQKEAQKMLGLDDKISLFSFRLFDENDLDEVMNELAVESKDLTVTPWTTLEPLLVAVTKMQSGFLQLWFFIVVLAISFGLVNTLFMSIFERKQEFYLLEALGMKPRWTVCLVLFESLILLLIGTILGILTTLASVFALQGGIDISQFSRGTEMLRAPSLVVPRIVLNDWLLAISLILGLGTLGSLYPAWRAIRKKTTSKKKFNKKGNVSNG